MYEQTEKRRINEKLFPQRKPLVFISGRCDEEYEPIRKQITEWFADFPLVELYDFNSDTASTLPLEESYLSKVDVCDVFLLILDNEKGITSGTQKEIDRALQLGKPFIEIFINSNANGVQAQELFPHLKEPRYMSIQSFDEAAKEAIRSILQDIVDCYHMHLYHSQTDQADSFVVADIGVNKDIHSAARPLANYLICRDYPYFSKDELDDSEFSQVLLNTFQCIVGLSSFSSDCFSKIAQYFVSKAEEPIKEVIAKRHETLRLVFSGQLRDAKTQLQSIQGHIESLPEWLKNDIYLDLRNLSIRLDHNEGLFRYDVDGQKELNSSKVEIHYPYLDRCYAKVWEGLDECFYSRKGRPVGTITLGENLDFYYFLAEAFVTALSFGSYTHLLVFRQKYFRFQYRLCYDGNEPKRFGELNRLAILMSSEKDLKSIWNSCPHDTDAFSECKLTEVAAMLKTMPVREEKHHASFLALSYLGDYFKEEDFVRIFQICNGECISRICEGDKAVLDVGLMIEAYRRNIRRIGRRIEGFLDASRDHHFATSDIRSISLLCDSGLRVHDLFSLFFDYVKDRTKLDGYAQYSAFFINARLKYPEFSLEIDNFVRDNANQDEYAEYCRFCLVTRPIESIEFFAKSIIDSLDYLVTQPGLSYPLALPCDEAREFISVHQNELFDNASYNALAETAIKLLESDVRVAEAKFSAVRLLCVMNSCGLGREAISTFSKRLLSVISSICNGLVNSPMESVTSANVWLALCVLSCMYNDRQDYLIREALSARFSNPRDEVAALSVLHDALSFSKENVFSEGTMVSIMTFSWQSMKKDDAIVSDWGLAVLESLGKYPNFKDTIARGFRDLFSFTSAKQRVAIITYFSQFGVDNCLNAVAGQCKKDLSWTVRDSFASLPQN